MKKIVLVLLFILFIPIVKAEDAYGMYVNTTSFTIEEGKTSTLVVTLKNAVGEVKVTSSDSSIASASFDDFIDSASQSIVIKANREGTTRIIVTPIEVGSYDYHMITSPIVVTVKVVKPAQNTIVNEIRETTTPTTTQATTRKTEVVTQNVQPEVPTTEPVEVAPEVTDTPDIVVYPRLSELKVIGYKIDFNSDKKDYAIKLDKDVCEVYIEAKTDGEFLVEGAGIINICENKKHDILVKDPNSDVSNTYSIEFSEKEVEVKNNTLKIALLFVALVIAVIIIIVLLYKNEMINNKKAQ